MTTNNPPIAAWAPSSALAKLASRHNNAPCVLTDGPAEFNDVALVRLSDYEALQAECEKLRQEVEALQGIQPEMPPMPPTGEGLPRYGLRWNGPSQPLSVPKGDGYWTPWHLAQAECEKLRTALAESRANDQQAMRYLNQVREIVGGDDFPDMVRRCEKLRKDAERYRSLLEAVLREIPHREGRRGNAPGHGHSVPGVWDEDNGALAGKECAWCKVWNEALTAMEGDKP